MKVVVLSRAPNIYSTRRIVSVARRRGHNVVVHDPTTLSISIAHDTPRVYHGDDEVRGVDAVIPRIGTSVTYYGLAVLRQFEMQGAAVLNSASGIGSARDKLRCHQVLGAGGVPMPDTAFSRRAGGCGATRDVGEGPLVIKLLDGTQGKGVMLAQSRIEARSIIDAFQAIDEHILIQRFIAECAGKDIRAFVVGREVVAMMERSAEPGTGEFRSNLHMGGTARAIPHSASIARVALRATKLLGLDVAGVDVLVGNSGPMIIEVNPCPGLEGIEGSTGVNVAGRMIEALERKALGAPQCRRARA